MTWFNNWVNHYYADNSGWSNDHSKANKPYFTGEMCFSLRRSFLHDVNSDIEAWGDKEDEDFYYSYEFRLAVSGADSVGLSWVNQDNEEIKLIKTRIFTVKVDQLCECICLSAERYYREKDSLLFKDNKVNFIDYNSLKV
ncbi:hypothetical protein [Rossellomorea marisflavi]|uniref:hypothetical protein n=1 Tax=Rossellomorea marisflavi TaxID=189381 RepID=UPI003FA18502